MRVQFGFFSESSNADHADNDIPYFHVIHPRERVDINASCNDTRTLKKKEAVTLDYKTGQISGSVSTCVDIDPVWPNVGLQYGRVAMYDNFAEPFFIEQKIFANPKQIVLALFCE